MPAPLGKTPTKKMPKIEVFGLEDSQPTRAAVRFFRERRIVVRFVDLRKKPIDPAQLRQFVSRLGAALLDADSRGPTDAGPADITTNRGSLIARIHADVRLLRLPLVRYGDDVTAGQDETTWRAWLARRNR
jgi:arsenate reductase